MARIHLILQGKGGVGKSLLATILAQYFLSKDQQPLLIDTDPVNQTFASIKSLGVEHINIMNGDDIEQRHFDQIVEKVAGCTDDQPVVIDNGSASFVPLCCYLVSNDVVSLFQEMGHQVYLHTIIIGGQSLADTLGGFASLAEQLPTASLVIWQNTYFGTIAHKGKSLEQMATYQKYSSRVHALLTLPSIKQGTFDYDLKLMMAHHLTFDEAIHNVDFSIMTRQRLKVLQRQYFSHLEQSQL